MSRPNHSAQPDPHAEITALILADLDAGVRPWTRPWSSGGAVSRPLRHDGRPYHGANVHPVGPGRPPRLQPPVMDDVSPGARARRGRLEGRDGRLRRLCGDARPARGCRRGRRPRRRQGGRHPPLRKVSQALHRLQHRPDRRTGGSLSRPDRAACGRTERCGRRLVGRNRSGDPHRRRPRLLPSRRRHGAHAPHRRLRRRRGLLCGAGP